jgi:hypothetical protein
MGMYDQLEELNKAPLSLPPTGEKSRAVQESPDEKASVTQNPTQRVTRNNTQVSKPAIRQVRKLPTTEEVEDLSYALRRVPKTRVNADVPQEWKDQLDEIAYQLRVGKYELMLYVIGEFLGQAAEQGWLKGAMQHKGTAHQYQTLSSGLIP